MRPKQTMQLTFLRRDSDGRYETDIVRGDGVRYSVLGVAHAFAIPHDLAHYVVEKALGLDDGFWGSIAAGGVFPTMRYVEGRRKPHAEAHARSVLKANARGLREAELVVRIFNDTFEQGHGAAAPVLSRRLAARYVEPGRQRRIFDAKAIAAVHASYHTHKQRWDSIPVGEALTVDW